MTILPSDLASPAAPGTDRVTPRGDAVYARQWKKALEDAQWTARRSAESQSGKSGNGQSSEGATAGIARLPSTAPVAREPASALQQQPASTPRAQGLAAAADRMLLAALAGNVAEGTPAASPLALATLSEAPPAPMARTVKPVVLVPWSELPEWPATMMHASMTAAGISVMVRDAAIGEGDARALYFRLRGKLQAAGYELSSFIVNGKEASPAPAGDAYV